MNDSNSLKTLAARLSTRAALAIAAMIVACSLLTAFLCERSAQVQATEAGQIAAAQAVADVRSQFEHPMGVVAAMRDALVAARRQGASDRAFHNGLLSATLRGNPELLATWTAWEPNAFDGRDAAFGGAQGHDTTGRFVPYWHREGTDIALEPLTDYDKSGAGDYYLLAHNSGRPVLLEPYE